YIFYDPRWELACLFLTIGAPLYVLATVYFYHRRPWLCSGIGIGLLVAYASGVCLDRMSFERYKERKARSHQIVISDSEFWERRVAPNLIGLTLSSLITSAAWGITVLGTGACQNQRSNCRLS